MGCHPLFGPQSGRSGVAGKSVVLSHQNNPEFVAFENILNILGLAIVKMIPSEHDDAMANTQALELLIGRLLIDLELKRGRISTPGYDLLLELKELLKEDSVEILNGIHRNNPYTIPLREKVVSTLHAIVSAIEKDTIHA